MARLIFPEWTQTLKKHMRVLLLGGPIYVIVLAAYAKSPETLRIGYMPEQPVAYSHEKHAGQLGMDCMYCHNTVDKAAHAAVPPATTCMNCHRAIHYSSDKLAAVREAYAGGKPVKWVKVHDLPDYVYFNHSAHVTRGVGCESCHGRIDQMEEVYQAKALTMGWCLDCHREPAWHLRAPKDITKMGYDYAKNFEAGKARQKENNINPSLDCSTCHR